MGEAPKLKPCPFCASHAVYRRANPPYHPVPMWTAGCDFGCATSVDLPSKKEAAGWWNRRRKTSLQPNFRGSDHPATCLEEFYEGDEVAYLRDTLKEATRERDHFHNQWRACWAPLTPRSENEKQGFERVLAILKSKLSEGGGIVGPSEVQRAHNDFYRGRRVAFEECATMLRAALATEGKANG